MWKVLPTLSRKILWGKSVVRFPQIRYFLSDSFKLENVWRERLQSTILKRINVTDMFYELDNQFQHFAYASALDIDLFVNAVSDDSCFDEVEDILYKLRLSPEAINMLPSTHHAIIRLYMEWNKTDDLMRVLDDRLNYGIFPDHYCSVFMIDSFIKAGNFRDAAKVSSLGMLQEDVSNPLLKYLSLYACHKYLENPVPWTEKEDENKEEEEDDDEVVKVRVKYLRNPYFDDHFDLVDPHHVIGKTLTYIGSEIDDSVGRTYKLLGLILHEKFDIATKYIATLSSSKESGVLTKDGITLANKILEDKSKMENKDDKFITSANQLKEVINKSFIESHLEQEKSLLEKVEFTIKDLVPKYERAEIEKQLEAYKEWERLREQLLMKQVEKLNREKQLAEVQRQKQLLQEKEEELFFFENEPKLDLIIEEKEKKRAEQQERDRQILEARQPPKKIEKWNKPKPPEPTLEDYFDENIPIKLIKTK